ncbi:MAG TPA: hypothetical protein VM759_11265 [Longimicrobium sp.]|nr:hypothetical protein [Longimicrobium sp.]
MAQFDRNDDRGFDYRDNPDRDRFTDRAQGAVRRGWDRVENAFEGQGGRHDRDEHLRRDYENRSIRDTGYGASGRGWNAGGRDRSMDREGGLHQRNSWSDGAWTADAAERTDREWNLSNRGHRDDRDARDTTPFQAGWRAGEIHERGRERGWNLAGGDWGHSGSLGSRHSYDRGYAARGEHGEGFVDRAQNAIRRGWDNVEDRLDSRDDRGRMHAGSSRYDREWHRPSDIRSYRDEEGRYGLMHTGGPRGMRGMNRYGGDYGRMGAGLDRGYDRGFKSRERVDVGDPFGDRERQTPIRMMRGGTRDRIRYDRPFRGNRTWF